MALEFEWDRDKAKENVHKHGVSFAEASSVFFDPNEVTQHDEEHSAIEDRFKTIGMSQWSRLLLVVHCERGPRIRIISARRAEPDERAIYEAVYPEQ